MKKKKNKITNTNTQKDVNTQVRDMAKKETANTDLTHRIQLLNEDENIKEQKVSIA